MNGLFDGFARKVSEALGHSWAFSVAFIMVIGWSIGGLVFGFSDSYQLIINTSTTIITYLMVFVIQNTTNRDNLAINAKLDALIEHSKATNKLKEVEEKSEAEIKRVRKKTSINGART